MKRTIEIFRYDYSHLSTFEMQELITMLISSLSLLVDEPDKVAKLLVHSQLLAEGVDTTIGVLPPQLSFATDVAKYIDGTLTNLVNRPEFSNY